MADIMRNEVLVYRCGRRKHLVARLVAEDGVLYVEAERVAVDDHKRSSWTPGRWQVRRGHAQRCGCACGHSWLLFDDDTLKWLDDGYREMHLPAARMNHNGPVR
jgi:hypothetical protein